MEDYNHMYSIVLSADSGRNINEKILEQHQTQRKRSRKVRQVQEMNDSYDTLMLDGLKLPSLFLL